MADTPIIINETIAAVDSITTLYSSPATGFGTLITAFTASNDGGPASVSYKGYIYDSAGTPMAVIPQTIVVKDRFHSGPSMVNQTVPPGGTIRVENSAANGLNFYATGREQS